MTEEKATRREWNGLAVIALPCVLYAMDLTVLNLAVPRLSEDLKPTSAQLLWILDIYGFLVAGSLITMGNIGDRIGRRRLLMIGAAAFGVASVIAAFSTSAGMLIATRALLGVAGATLAPSTLSLIRTMFRDPQERTVSQAFFALIDIHKYHEQISSEYHAEWFDIKERPKLIFDHEEMVKLAQKELRYQAALHPILFE